jgi:hypothetical protein
MNLVRAFTSWAVANSKAVNEVVTFDGRPVFHRFEFLRPDEWCDHTWERYAPASSVRPNRLPWWLPFNAFVHRWTLAEGVAEEFHDHPRWSVTICLSGCIVERTPWGERLLKPGSVVIRSRKAIHAFRAPDGHAGETWTLFIVGRRRHRQNTYVVTPQ